jgi:hypothetical protein
MQDKRLQNNCILASGMFPAGMTQISHLFLLGNMMLEGY